MMSNGYKRSHFYLLQSCLVVKNRLQNDENTVFDGSFEYKHLKTIKMKGRRLNRATFTVRSSKMCEI